jgi:heterodisulfide reductase subunit C2
MEHAEKHSCTLADKVERLTSQSPMLCYQCGKCSAGCPVRDHMADSPNQVVRLVQLGYDDEAIKSSTIWLCAGCLTCSARCPQNFDIAKFMDALRQIALEEGVPVKEKDTVIFHKTFLDQVRKNGKAFEFGMVRDYKLRSLNLMQDVDVAPEMFIKGKIGLFPHRVKDRDEIKKIFDETE